MKTYKLLLPLVLAIVVPAGLKAEEHAKKDKPAQTRWSGEYAKAAEDAKDSIGTLKAKDKTFTLKGTAEIAAQLVALGEKKVTVIGKLEGETIEVSEVKEATVPAPKKKEGGAKKEGEEK